MYTVVILAISMTVVVSYFIFTGILLNVTINTVCHGRVYGNHIPERLILHGAVK